MQKILRLKVFRYLVSGGCAASVTLGVLFVLTDYFNVWHVLSAFFAYSAGFGISFAMQKFWTFQNNSKDLIKEQMGMYAVIFVIGNILNVMFVYLFTTYFAVHYLLAQVLSIGIIAVGNYFVYKNMVFKHE